MITPYRPLPLTYDCRYDAGVEHCAILEVATTPLEKAKGLMYRTYLPAWYGMLFVREESEYRSFWMKNTLIPLHMYFLDSEKNVADQTTMQPCLADPCPVYTSHEEAMYVVEVAIN